MVKHLPSVFQVLGSIPQHSKKKESGFRGFPVPPNSVSPLFGLKQSFYTLLPSKCRWAVAFGEGFLVWVPASPVASHIFMGQLTVTWEGPESGHSWVHAALSLLVTTPLLLVMGLSPLLPRCLWETFVGPCFHPEAMCHLA